MMMSNHSHPVMTRSEVWSPAAVLEQFGGDDALLREVVALFLADCPERVEELRSAVQQKDGEAIRQAAHTLKGAIANFTADGPTLTVASIEEHGRFERSDEAAAALSQLESQLELLLCSMRQFLDTSPGCGE